MPERANDKYIVTNTRGSRLSSVPSWRSPSLETRTVKMIERPVRMSLEIPAQGSDWRNRVSLEDSTENSHFVSFLLFTGFIINQLKMFSY